MRCKPEEGWGRLHQEFFGFPGGSDDKESACSAGDLGLILGSGRSPGEGNGNPLQYSCQEGLLKDKPTATRVGGRAGPMSPQSGATSSGRALGGGRGWGTGLGAQRGQSCRVAPMAGHHVALGITSLLWQPYGHRVVLLALEQDPRLKVKLGKVPPAPP